MRSNSYYTRKIPSSSARSIGQCSPMQGNLPRVLVKSCGMRLHLLLCAFVCCWTSCNNFSFSRRKVCREKEKLLQDACVDNEWYLVEEECRKCSNGRNHDAGHHAAEYVEQVVVVDG